MAQLPGLGVIYFTLPCGTEGIKSAIESSLGRCELNDTELSQIYQELCLAVGEAVKGRKPPKSKADIKSSAKLVVESPEDLLRHDSLWSDVSYATTNGALKKLASISNCCGELAEALADHTRKEGNILNDRERDLARLFIQKRVKLNPESPPSGEAGEFLHSLALALITVKQASDVAAAQIDSFEPSDQRRPRLDWFKRFYSILLFICQKHDLELMSGRGWKAKTSGLRLAKSLQMLLPQFMRTKAHNALYARMTEAKKRCEEGTTATE